MPGVHTLRSPSGIDRIRECPGSPARSEGLPSRSSAHAARGTAAHEIAEAALMSDLEPVDFVGNVIDVEGYEVEIDDDLAESLQVYVDYCRGEIEPGDDVRLEQRVEIARHLGVGAEYSGTGDFVRFRPSTGDLLVTDYKNGVRPVKGLENWQVRSYALGAAYELGLSNVRSITTAIIQPNGIGEGSEDIKTDTFDVLELLDFAEELRAVLLASMEPDAPLHAGEHCRYCPAAPTCETLAETALQLAGLEFEDNVLSTPPDPKQLAADRIGELLSNVGVLKLWITALENEAFVLLREGVGVQGWKRVAKRARKKWVDDDIAEARLRKLGVEPFAPRKLITPAAAEAKLKAKKGAVFNFFVSESSGTSLARADDKRPAINPGSDFAGSVLSNDKDSTT